MELVHYLLAADLDTGCSLASLHVADAMTPNPVTLPPDTRLDVAVQEYLLHQDERALPVLSDGRLLGLLSISDVRHVPPEQ